MNDTDGYYGLEIYNDSVQPFILYSNFTEYKGDCSYTVPAKHYEELGDLDPPTLTIWPINYYGSWAILKAESSGSLTVISLPGVKQEFSVPNGLYILNITIEKVSGGSFYVFVLDTQNFVRGYINENITEHATLTIPYPEPGTWKIVILSQDTPVSFNASIKLVSMSNLTDFESYLNGIVLAQRLNGLTIPYKGQTIEKGTLEEVYIVDFGGSVPSSLNSELSAEGINVTRINSISQLIDVLFRLGQYQGESIVLVDEYSNLWFPGLIEAAFHGAPIVLINESILDAVVWSQRVFTWVKLMADNYHEHLELSPLPVWEYAWGTDSWCVQGAYDKWMKNIYNSIKYGLEPLFAYNASLIIVANRYTIPMFLDRALEGEIITGRIYRNDLNFKKQSSLAIALAYRAALHDALIRANPAYTSKKILASFIVYAWDWSYPYWPIDNYGNNFVDYTAPEHFNRSTIEKGYSVEFHTEKTVIAEKLSEGVLMWYYSGHGLGGSGFGLFTPDSLRAYEEGGNITNPDVDSSGWVNPPYNQYVSIEEVNTTFGNFHSALILSLGCVSGAWGVPDVMIQHGASVFVASITLHWGVIGEKLFITIIDNLANGAPVGTELKYALILYSRIWSEPKPYVSDPSWRGTEQDDNAPVVLYGDPAIKLLGNKDTDGDGITDKLEEILGTNPTNSDTDSDELSDSSELYIYGTSPTQNDTDNDNLNDYEELFTYNTDPTNADTDGDGMPDGWEVQYGLNATQNDASQDVDSDGLTNLGEYQYGTDPTNADTDGDGFTDYEEMQAHTDPLDPNSYPRTSNGFGVSQLLVIIIVALLLIIIVVVLSRR